MTGFLQSPFAWGLLALLPIIVIMYLLKLKRQKVTIPSTLLWQKAMQDMVANSPFQRLRNNLLMWLQLLFLLLLILAFMRPVWDLPNTDESTYVLLIDHSASMQVKEGTETRLDLAKEKALEIIDGMKPDDRAIVLAFSDRTNIIQTLTTDKLALRTKIRSIEPRDVGTSVRDAALILEGLTTVQRSDGGREPLRNTQSIIISDGVVEGLDALADVPNLEYIAVGTEFDNLGITGLDVRESFADTFEYQIFASISSSYLEDQEVIVELMVDDEIIDIKSTTVPAEGTAGVVFSTAEMLDGIATIQLDSNDAFELDNMVKARISPPSNIEVLLVSEGNQFLEQVLLIDPRVELSMIRSTDYDPNSDYDITIFDGGQIGQIGEGNFVFMNSIPPIDGFAVAGDPITNPEIIDWNRVHPLNRFVNFETVLVGETKNYTQPQTSIPILESIDTQMMTLSETETQHVLVIGFDIFKSYWPLDVSFPIFISNMVDYFARNSTSSVKPTYQTGSSITLFSDRDSSTAQVFTPDNKTMQFNFEGSSTAHLTDTMVSGLYRVVLDSGTEFTLPVNLLSEDESMIAPRESISIAERTLISTGDKGTSNQEIWKWFVLAALAFILIEWLLYCRRTFM